MTNKARTALVTGASRGIGRATLLRLVRDGFRTIAHYGSSDAGAISLVEEARTLGQPPHLVKADLKNPEEIGALAKQIAAHATDGLDALIHNAGIALRKPFTDIAVEELDGLYAVNVRAPFVLTQQLSPILNEGASIVFLSTVATRHQFDGLSAYAMTKAAIEAFATQIAKDFGARGIAVNTIAPGAIETDMSPALRMPSERETILARQALQRVGKPEDIADAIALLLSTDARWITGAVIPVSGGTKL